MDRIVMALAFPFCGANAQAPVKIVVTSEVVREGFRGVGFHGQLFLDSATPEYWDQVVAKRWRELNPGFARVFHNWTRGDKGVRDPQALETLARELVFMKESTETEVYLTTSSPQVTAPGEERRSATGTPSRRSARRWSRRPACKQPRRHWRPSTPAR